jgi:hypothetical protein
MSVDTSASAAVTLAKLSDALRRAATDVAWVQWRALGAHAATRVHARSLVDPEALVLISLALANEEPRLRDIVADWATLNSPLLSVQRLKNLTALSPDVRGTVGAFARLVLTEGMDARWRSLVAAGAPGPGLTRRINKLRAREASQLDDAALWLRLRLGLGVGIKADATAFLLGTTGAWANVRTIAAATSYTVPAVRRALEDLASARLILAREDPHVPTQYGVRGEVWADMLALEAPLPAWRTWQARFAFVIAFLSWAERARRNTVSRYAFGVKGRELMSEHIAAFEQQGPTRHQAQVPAADRARQVETSVLDLARRMVHEV